MNTFDLLFWLSLSVAAYAFVGYPLLAIALAARRPPAAPPAPGAQPPLTVVVAARDEAPNIAARVHNLLASHYPPQHLRVLVVDDGSRDGTADAVESLGDPRVRVLRLAQPGGKALALNAAMAQVDTPLTVFADARQRFLPNAIAALSAPFDDPAVGAVAGELVLTENDASGDPVAANGAYWRLERALRDAEGRLGWAHAASGAIYAIRTELFRPLPKGLLLDDVYTPLQVVRSGQVIRVARDAVAHEPATAELGREFRRKVRTLTGNWQLIAVQPWLLHPLHNPVFFAWSSHKFSRLLAPWALLVALLAAPFAASALVVAAFWLQLAAYALALSTILFPIVARRVPLAGTAGSFVALNAAALVSLPVWLGRRDLDGLWKR